METSHVVIMLILLGCMATYIPVFMCLFFTAVLGFLQIDSHGNVNVSRRGPGIKDYVGPGGFPSIIQSATASGAFIGL